MIYDLNIKLKRLSTFLLSYLSTCHWLVHSFPTRIARSHTSLKELISIGFSKHPSAHLRAKNLKIYVTLMDFEQGVGVFIRTFLNIWRSPTPKLLLVASAPIEWKNQTLRFFFLFLLPL